MGPTPSPQLPSRAVYLVLFLLAALDRAGWGCWALLRPAGVFKFLQLPRPLLPDQLLLWKVLAGLALAHALVFVILVYWPEDCGPVALVPLLGLAVGTGLWLWAAGTERLTLPSRVPPLLLAAHEAVWLPPLAWFLVARHRWRRRPSLPLSSPSSRP
jgi:hypothetical protein